MFFSSHFTSIPGSLSLPSTRETRLRQPFCRSLLSFIYFFFLLFFLFCPFQFSRDYTAVHFCSPFLRQYSDPNGTSPFALTLLLPIHVQFPRASDYLLQPLVTARMRASQAERSRGFPASRVRVARYNAPGDSPLCADLVTQLQCT